MAGHLAGNSGRAMMRVSDVDRDRVAQILGTAYTDGRLSRDEYDQRLGQALSARTFADLDPLVADLPVAMAPPVRMAPGGPVVPVASTNGLAIASFVCGLGQFMFGPLGTIPAIVFGHMARNQIRRTGEQGTGLALAGLILGWGAVVLGIIAVIGFVLAVAVSTSGPAPMQMPVPMR